MARLEEPFTAISRGAKRNAAVGFKKDLKPSAALASIVVNELNTSDLVIDNKQVSTEELEIEGTPVAAGQAVQFRVDATNAVIGTTYRIEVIGTTNETPPQVIPVWIDLPCE